MVVVLARKPALEEPHAGKSFVRAITLAGQKHHHNLILSFLDQASRGDV